MVQEILAARIEFDPVGGWAMALPLAALFVAALVMGYRLTTRPVSGKVRKWLWGLRGGAAAVVMVLLVRPTLVEMKVSEVRQVLVVMEDDSRSMGIKDETGGSTRAAAMAEGLKSNEKQLEKLAEKFDLAAYQFSDGLKQVVGAGVQAGPTPSPYPLPSRERGEETATAKETVSRILAARPTMSGSSTRLGDCLKAAYEENRGRQLAGVLLLSDGASNLSTVPAGEAAQFLGRRGAAIYAVGYGSTEATGAVREIVAKNISAPATVFVGNRIEVTGDFVFYGLAGEKVAVELLADGKAAGSETVEVKGNRFTKRVGIQWQAEGAGSHRVELVAREIKTAAETANIEYPTGNIEHGSQKKQEETTPSPYPLPSRERGEEATTATETAGQGRALSLRTATTNNSIWTFVDAVEGGLKVLMVSGYLRPQGRFVAEALRSAGEFELTWIFAANKEEAARLVPVTAAQWGKFDAVIFDNLPRGYLSEEQMAGLAGAVGERGTGFLMIGGEHGFGPGGYAGTAVAGLLPVRMRAEDGEIKGPVRFKPTAAGIEMGILQLEKDKAASAKAWAEMPALGGAWKLGEAKSTAEIVARNYLVSTASPSPYPLPSRERGEEAKAADGEPLLVVGQYQKGRVAALGLATTHEWQMEGKDDPPGKYFRRFWRQLVLHLTGREARREGVWVATNERRYSLPELQSGRKKILATAGATDGQGNVVGDANLALTMKRFDGGSSDAQPGAAVPLVRRGENWEATVEAAQAGDYRLDLAVTRGGKELGKTQTRFVVYEPDVEMERPEADWAALEEVARASGGKMAPGRELGAVLKELAGREGVGQVRVEERHSLWDNGWVLVIFVGLMGAEWVVRKRKGLV